MPRLLDTFRMTPREYAIAQMKEEAARKARQPKEAPPATPEAAELRKIRAELEAIKNKKGYLDQTVEGWAKSMRFLFYCAIVFTAVMTLFGDMLLGTHPH